MFGMSAVSISVNYIYIRPRRFVALTSISYRLFLLVDAFYVELRVTFVNLLTEVRNITQSAAYIWVKESLSEFVDIGRLFGASGKSERFSFQYY